MKIYILVSAAGHYHAAYRTRKEAEQEGLNRELVGFHVWEDTL